MKKEIAKQLKSDYEKLEIKTSGDLWNQIEVGLDATNKTAQKPLFQWWKYAAVIVLLISFGSLFYFQSIKTKNISENIVIRSNDLIKTAEKELIPRKNKGSNFNHFQNKEKIALNSEKNVIIQKTVENLNKTIEKDLNNNLVYIQKAELMIKDNNEVAEEKIINQIAVNPVAVENKRINYIKADELLLGRELDKTREESQNSHKQFGILDASKIKIKSPNSLKILGFTIFQDSLEAK